MNLRDIVYGAFIVLVAAIIQVSFPSLWMQSSILDPPMGVIIAFFTWSPNGKKLEDVRPIPLISREDFKLCGSLCFILFLFTVYTQGFVLGVGYIIDNLLLFSLATFVLFSMTWLLGSLVPRFLYRRGLLKYWEISQSEPSEPADEISG